MSGSHDHDHGHDHGYDHLAGPPSSGSEVVTLLGSLERQRRTLARKCGDLGAEGMRATVGASTMTLGGLLKHLALIEDYTFATKFLGRSPGQPWESVDWDADEDWDWHSAAQHTPAELDAMLADQIATSEASLEEALADGGLDRAAVRPRGDGSVASLRWILVHLVEEYARHCGHADLIRESIDGATNL